MLKNYSDISQNNLIKEYYKKKETLDNNLQKISLIVESFEEKSNIITEEIRLQEFIKNSHLQASIQHQDNIKLARETEYLEERLKIIEKRQKIELGLLEKKFQWQYGVKQLQKKYNASLENLKLDNDTSNNNNDINTYQQKMNLSKNNKISWDHPPFNNYQPNYNSLNIPSKKILESIDICNVEIPPVNNVDDIEEVTPLEPTTVPLVTVDSTPVSTPAPVADPVSTSEPVTPTPVATPAPVDSTPVATSSPVLSTPPPVTPVVSSANNKSIAEPVKNDFRTDNVSLEQQLRQAFQNKFSHLKENSDSESSDEF